MSAGEEVGETSSAAAAAAEGDHKEIVDRMREWIHFFHVYCSRRTPTSLRNKLVKQVFSKSAFNTLQVLTDNIRRSKFPFSGAVWSRVYKNQKLIRDLSNPKVSVTKKRKLLMSKKTPEIVKEIIIPALEYVISHSE